MAYTKNKLWRVWFVSLKAKVYYTSSRILTYMEPSSKSEYIDVVVWGQDGRHVRYKVKSNASLSGVMNEYSKRRGIDGLRFFHNGKRITKRHTAANLGLENGGQIEAMLEMNGGGCKVF